MPSSGLLRNENNSTYVFFFFIKQFNICYVMCVACRTWLGCQTLWLICGHTNLTIANQQLCWMCLMLPLVLELHCYHLWEQILVLGTPSCDPSNVVFNSSFQFYCLCVCVLCSHVCASTCMAQVCFTRHLPSTKINWNLVLQCCVGWGRYTLQWWGFWSSTENFDKFFTCYHTVSICDCDIAKRHILRTSWNFSWLWIDHGTWYAPYEPWPWRGWFQVLSPPLPLFLLLLLWGGPVNECL